MEIIEKLMFLRYASPCVDDFVLQDLMSEKYAKKIIQATKRGAVIPNSEKQFDLAYIMCQHTARKMGCSKIDADVIRAYYINIHNKLIGIHKPVACSEEDCKIKIFKDKGLNDDCFFRKKDFTEDKNNIVVHRGYVVDLLANNELEKILLKSSFLETH